MVIAEHPLPWRMFDGRDPNLLQRNWFSGKLGVNPTYDDGFDFRDAVVETIQESSVSFQSHKFRYGLFNNRWGYQ
jgi:hypothetical protein